MSDGKDQEDAWIKDKTQKTDWLGGQKVSGWCLIIGEVL
jgi:hypothetical protein